MRKAAALTSAVNVEDAFAQQKVGLGVGLGLGLGLGLGPGLGLGLGLGMGGSTVCQCDTRGAPSAARDSTTRVWSRIRRGHMPTPEREVATSAETCSGLALGSG